MALFEVSVEQVTVQQFRERSIRHDDRVAVHGTAAFRTFEDVCAELTVETEVTVELLATVAKSTFSTVEVKRVEWLGTRWVLL